MKLTPLAKLRLDRISRLTGETQREIVHRLLDAEYSRLNVRITEMLRADLERKLNT